MNKLKEIFKILAVNVCIIILILFVFDFCVYRNLIDENALKSQDSNTVFKYMFFNPKVYTLDINKFGRISTDNKYINDAKPIILMGCSYAYGMNLDNGQTFAYKISELLKRNVINKAILAGGIQHMYYLSSNEAFYKKTKKSKDIIYILIEDQYRRILVYTFFKNHNIFYLHYTKKNNELIIDNYKNPFINLFKSLYISKLMNHIWVYKYVNNEKNADKLTNLELLYFEKIKNNIENHWGKVNFNIIIYGNYMYSDMMSKKLKNKGFNVIKCQDLTNEDIKQGKYISDDNHPTEAAWDLLTPLIAKKLVLN